MNKFASQVKEAEVRGAMAAFVDAGLVKVANQYDFDELCDVVADNVGYDYDLQKIAAVTEAALNGDGMNKYAAENLAFKATLGDLLLMKTAGQIDNRTFVREVNGMLKVAADGAKKPFKDTIKEHWGRNKHRYGYGLTGLGALGAGVAADRYGPALWNKLFGGNSEELAAALDEAGEY